MDEYTALCKYIAETFGCPCDFSPLDEEMWERCFECGDSNEECWRKVAKMAAEKHKED